MRLSIGSFPLTDSTKTLTVQVDKVDEYFFDGLAEQAIITSGNARYHAVKYPGETVWKTDLANKLS
jgi:hypothetical protein